MNKKEQYYLLLEKAKRSIKNNKFKEAEKILLDLEKNNKNDPEISFELGKIFHITGKNRKSIEYLKKSLKSNSKNVHSLYLLAKSYKYIDDISNYSKTILKIKDSSKDMKDALSEIGYYYSARKNYKKAVKFLTEASLKDVSNIHDIFYELGKNYKATGDYFNTLKSWMKALQNGYSKPEIQKELAEILFKLKNDKKTQRVRSLLKKQGLLKNDFYLELARLQKEEGSYKEAIKSIKQSKAEGEERLRYWTDLSDLYLSVSEHNQAKKIIQNALNTFKENGELEAKLSRIYAEMGSLKKALTHMKKAIKKGYISIWLKKDIASFHRQLGNYEEAETGFKELARLKETALYGNHELGKLMSEQGKTELAVKYLKKSLDCSPDNVEKKMILEELAFSYELKGNFEKAAETWCEYQKSFPDELKPLYETGFVYKNAGNYKEAAKAFKKLYSKIEKKSNKSFKNKILNEIEMCEGRIHLKSKPRVLWVTISNICHLKCIGCSDWRHTKWRLSNEQCDQIIKLYPYIEHVLWQGGEVFLHPEFKRMFYEASKYTHLKQSITTNGLLIDDKWARLLAKRNVALIYSIDGFTKKTYENIRRGADFDKLKKNLLLINKYKEKINNDNADPANMISTQINCIVMKSNYREIEKSIEFAKKYKIDVLNLFPIRNVYNHENIFLFQDAVALKQIEKSVKVIEKKAIEYGINFISALPTLKELKKCPVKWHAKKHTPDKDGVITAENYTDRLEGHYLTAEEKEKMNNFKRKKKGVNNKIQCWYPWQSISIGPDRKFKPQCFCPAEVGYASRESIMKVWNNKRTQYYRYSILSGEYNWCSDDCMEGLGVQEDLRFQFIPES